MFEIFEIFAYDLKLYFIKETLLFYKHKPGFETIKYFNKIHRYIKIK